MTGATIMGAPAHGERWPGMVGGGWRVDGLGGPTTLELTVQHEPPDGPVSRLVFDRWGRLTSMQRVDVDS